MNKLEKKIIISGHIEAITGLHIGGTNSSMDIGEIDNAVIKHPIKNEPYIPGSSLKGKMRSLTEIARGEIGTTKMGIINFSPSNNPDHLSAKLFGYTGFRNRKDVIEEDKKHEQQPSRIIVRDGYLMNAEDMGRSNLSEIKAETVIDRITSAAMPRQMERVPSGAKFSLEIILNILEGDVDKDDFLPAIFRALELVQDDYLGGAGSRGSGQVKFVVKEVIEKSAATYISGADSKDLTSNFIGAYAIEIKPKSTATA